MSAKRRTPPLATGSQGIGRAVLADLQALKDAVDFQQLVSETRDVDRAGKVLCPAHVDHTPSCHIYPDGFKCYSCGAHGDVVDWLELVHNLSTAEAIRELERTTGTSYGRRVGGVPTTYTAPRRTTAKPKAPTFKPVDETLLEQHHRLASQSRRVPSAMEGRGLTLEDQKRLGFAAVGKDAIFPIPGPDGVVLALKRRYAEPHDGQRYRYTTPGHGTPPWCSPDFSQGDTVLIVEGELNGMACYLARPDLAVMGVAGTGGGLHLEVLKGKQVYIYADGDDPGQKARDKWARQALEAGAVKVYTLEPWGLDACDLAGQQGRAALADLLTRSIRGAGLVTCEVSAAKPREQHKPRSRRARIAARMKGWGRGA